MSRKWYKIDSFYKRRKLYALYQMTLPMTLSDLNHHKSHQFYVLVLSSGMAEARVLKFCIQVAHIKYWPLDDTLPPNRHGQNHVTHFNSAAPSLLEHISNLICMLIVLSTSKCVIDYPKMWCVQGQVTSLNFGK